MRYSTLFAKTLRSVPKDEVAINAKYLIQGGFIDKLMSGSYTILPLGRLILRKIEQIIREEMDAIGAQEMMMPLLHPKEIWNETGRWDSAREVMYQFEKDEKKPHRKSSRSFNEDSDKTKRVKFDEFEDGKTFSESLHL